MTLDDLRRLPVSELLPHRPPMLFLERLVALESDSAETELTLRPDSAFVIDGRVGAWVGIEYMAQTVAILAGVQNRLAGRPPRVGLLLGTRELTANVSSFSVGDTLRVKATHVLFDPNGLSVVDCSIRDARSGAEWVKAALTGVEVDDFAAFVREHGS